MLLSQDLRYLIATHSAQVEVENDCFNGMLSSESNSGWAIRSG